MGLKQRAALQLGADAEPGAVQVVSWVGVVETRSPATEVAVLQIIGIRSLRSGLAGAAIIVFWLLILMVMAIASGPRTTCGFHFAKFLTEASEYDVPQKVLASEDELFDKELPSFGSPCIRLPKHDPDRNALRIPCTRRYSDRVFPKIEGPRWATNPDQSADNGGDVLTFEPMHLQAGEEHEKNSEKWLKKLIEEENVVVHR
jgi:hypothetical protein